MFIESGTGRAPKTLLLGLALCLVICLFSTTMGAGSLPLTGSGEDVVYGGSDCSDFLNGAAVGLGIGVLFGCVWCAAGALVAKGISLFC